MIVRMKKAAIITQSKDKKAVLEKVRSLGDLHVSHQQVPKGGDIESLKADITLIDEVLGVLPKGKHAAGPAQSKYEETGYWKVSAEHVRDLHNRIKQLEQHSRTLKRRIDEWVPWGDFDPEAVRRLASRNIRVGLYQIPVRDLKRIPPGVLMRKINVTGEFVNCAVVSRGQADIPFKEIPLPRRGLNAMQARLDENLGFMKKLKEALEACSGFRNRFLTIREDLAERLKFNEVMNGMGEARGIVYVTGFVPQDRVDRLRETAEKEKWGLLITDPSGTDGVPTLIRNPGWIEIIRPVFRVIQTFPAYHELDISFWFLTFFSIFYGMLIGDAGYGMVFLGLTLWAHMKFGKGLEDKSPFFLMYLLSSCTVLWGIGSGTFFGQAWLPSFVQPVVPALRDNQQVQRFCFTLGAAHLSIAHIWRGIRKFPSLSALSEAGWVCMLWGAFFLARMLILGDVFPSYGPGLFMAGAALVVVFTKPCGNILKGVSVGVGDLLLNMLNCFTDVVSYIRLFAVGTATVAVADAFNQLAMGVGYNGVIAGFAASLILFMGHFLNIILGVMAILVHGVRLNMLEFSGHLNMEWSGVPYIPFKPATKAETLSRP